MSLIEKVLKEYILLKRREIEDIDTKIKEQQVARAIVLNDIIKAKAEIEAMCTHQDTVEIPGTYMSGGYDHVSEQPYTIQCKNCGKVVASKLIRGTYA